MAVVPKGTKVCKGGKTWKAGQECPHLQEAPKQTEKKVPKKHQEKKD